MDEFILPSYFQILLIGLHPFQTWVKWAKSISGGGPLRLWCCCSVTDMLQNQIRHQFLQCPIPWTVMLPPRLTIPAPFNVGLHFTGVLQISSLAFYWNEQNISYFSHQNWVNLYSTFIIYSIAAHNVFNWSLGHRKQNTAQLEYSLKDIFLIRNITESWFISRFLSGDGIWRGSF